MMALADDEPSDPLYELCYILANDVGVEVNWWEQRELPDYPGIRIGTRDPKLLANASFVEVFFRYSAIDVEAQWPADELMRLLAQDLSGWDEIAARLLVEARAIGPEAWNDLERVLAICPIPSVILLADSLVKNGDPDSAFDVYRYALDHAWNPQAQLEIAYLLALRVGTAPLLHAFTWQQLPIKHLASGPTSPKTRRLLSLVVEGYGRLFGYYTYHGGEGLSEEDDVWLRLLTLDGLRAAFLEADELENAKATCLAFRHWMDHLSVPFSTDVDVEMNFELERRFADTRASIRERLLKKPGNRKAAAEALAGMLRQVWPELSPLTRNYAINAYILEHEKLHPADDWAPVVNEWSKSIEAELRDRLGVYLNKHPNQPLAQMLGGAINGGRRSPMKDFSRASLSTYADALTSVTSRLNNPQLKEIADVLQSVVRPRGRAAHSDAVWKISNEEAERVNSSITKLLALIASARFV